MRYVCVFPLPAQCPCFHVARDALSQLRRLGQLRRVVAPLSRLVDGHLLRLVEPQGGRVGVVPAVPPHAPLHEPEGAAEGGQEDLAAVVQVQVRLARLADVHLQGGLK